MSGSRLAVQATKHHSLREQVRKDHEVNIGKAAIRQAMLSGSKRFRVLTGNDRAQAYALARELGAIVKSRGLAGGGYEIEVLKSPERRLAVQAQESATAKRFTEMQELLAGASSSTGSQSESPGQPVQHVVSTSIAADYFLEEAPVSERGIPLKKYVRSQESPGERVKDFNYVEMPESWFFYDKTYHVYVSAVLSERPRSWLYKKEFSIENVAPACTAQGVPLENGFDVALARSEAVFGHSLQEFAKDAESYPALVEEAKSQLAGKPQTAVSHSAS